MVTMWTVIVNGLAIFCLVICFNSGNVYLYYLLILIFSVQFNFLSIYLFIWGEEGREVTIFQCVRVFCVYVYVCE